MRLLSTRLDGPLILEPAVFPDSRGFFAESFRRSVLADAGIHVDLVQHNHTRSRFGAIRGMHYKDGAGTAKLVHCTSGSIWDALVDVRRGSPTFGEWEAFALDDRNLRSLYVPVGFAHGFAVLSPVADVIYQQTTYYVPELEREIAYDDPEIGIDWPISTSDRVVARHDTVAPRLRQIADQLPFTYERRSPAPRETIPVRDARGSSRRSRSSIPVPVGE